MRTTVMLEDDVYAAAKQIAENSGRSLEFTFFDLSPFL
jgi:hypothetical protein